MMPESEATPEMSNVVRYQRLRQGSFYADFRRDKRLDPEVYHCVIQCEGSTEILRWSQHRTLNAAIHDARVELKRLSVEDQAELPHSPVQPT